MSTPFSSLQPRFAFSRTVFLRALGLCYFCAFASYFLQVGSLIGENGVLPLSEFLTLVKHSLGGERYLLLPTVFWFESSNLSLQLACVIGAAMSLLLMIGVLPLLCTVILWALYLSLVNASQIFVGYQWDMLLLEVGFLSIFLSPRCFLLHRASHREPHFLLLLLTRLLLFKLMFSSGMVKILSDDPSWKDFSALEYHYFTQPLPHIVSWYVAQLPQWFQQFSVGIMFFIELIVPFFLFFNSSIRHLGALLLIFLQLLILGTGNYGFFNLLTIALCLIAFDDQCWAIARRNSPGGLESKPFSERVKKFRNLRAHALPIALFLVICGSNIRWYFPQLFTTGPIAQARKYHDGFRLTSTYGLFAVMTTQRNEIVVEGSRDGKEWKEYEFYWKPGNPKRAPKWAGPHMPRFDWQMWFAALGNWRSQQNVFFLRFMKGVIEGNAVMNTFFAVNPFPDAPPKYLRASFWRYEFTDMNEREESGNWWKRKRIGKYGPVFSKKGK